MLKPKEFKADKAITLPSGKIAETREGTARDWMNAQKAVVGDNNPMAAIYALIAELVQIDGKQIVYEEVIEMNLKDFMVLQAEVLGQNFPGPPQPA